jgi:hypothetical protein
MWLATVRAKLDAAHKKALEIYLLSIVDTKLSCKSSLFLQVNVTSCHYLVDLDAPVEAEHEPLYSRNEKDWQVLISAKFLDSQRYTADKTDAK